MIESPGCTSPPDDGSAVTVTLSGDGTDANDETPANIGNPAATMTTTASKRPRHPAQRRMGTPRRDTPTA